MATSLKFDSHAASHDFHWSDAEKAIARRVFEHALHEELHELIREAQARADKVTEPDQLWALESFLAKRRREIDSKYEYTYSKLVFVFANLIRELRIHEQDLKGLTEDKLRLIRDLAAR